MTFTYQIARAVRAGVRGLVVTTPDEARALELLEDAGERLEQPVHTWSAAQGVDHDRKRHEPSEVLARLNESTQESIWVLFDAAVHLSNPLVHRHLRCAAQRSSGPTVVLVDPEPSAGIRQRIPELWQVDLPPPSRDELRAAIEDAADALEQSGRAGARATFSESLDGLASAAIGLERNQLDRLLAEAVLEHELDTASIEAFIASHKPAVLDRGGLLVEVDAAPEAELGGLQRYKHWLSRRRLALSTEAAEAGIVAPRGVLLLGVQGCGKSLAARVSAGLLGLPLVRLDMGSLFGGTVGQSEANLRRATSALERIAPVVAWLDEVDKGLAGVEGAASDAGTSARVFGGLLTWLAERSRPVFVVATANRVDRLPPELLRRGRLDEVFFIDLPDADERAEILRVHLERLPTKRLGHAPPTADPWAAFEELARSADGFSGAELEGALTEARLDALAERRDLAATDLRNALRATVPLSVSRAEDVDELRRWAAQRARPAS